LLTATVCGDGLPVVDPANEASVAGVSTIVGTATDIVTGRVCGVFDAPCDVMVTEPAYVPAARPTLVAVTVTVYEFPLPVMLAASQEPAGVTETVVVPSVVPAAELLTVTVCGAGLASQVPANVASVAGVSTIVGAETVIVTGRVCGVFDAPGDAMITEPVYVPATWPTLVAVTVTV
jgi:hypothetical protein